MGTRLSVPVSWWNNPGENSICDNLPLYITMPLHIVNSLIIMFCVHTFLVDFRPMMMEFPNKISKFVSEFSTLFMSLE